MESIKEATITILARFEKNAKGETIQDKKGKLYRKFKADNGFMFELYNASGDLEIGQTYLVQYTAHKLPNNSYFNWISKFTLVPKGLVGEVSNVSETVTPTSTSNVSPAVGLDSQPVVYAEPKNTVNKVENADVELFKYCGHIVGVCIETNKFQFANDEEIFNEIFRIYTLAKSKL